MVKLMKFFGKNWDIVMGLILPPLLFFFGLSWLKSGDDPGLGGGTIVFFILMFSFIVFGIFVFISLLKSIKTKKYLRLLWYMPYLIIILMLSWSIFGISGVINKPQMDECYDVSEYGETDKNAIAKSGIDTQSRDMYCTAISVQSVSRGTYLISLEQPCRTIYCSLTKTDNPECRYSNIGDVLSREVTKVDSKLCG